MNRTEGVLSEMRAMLTSMEMQDLFVSANTTRRAMKEIERLRAENDILRNDASFETVIALSSVTGDAEEGDR